MEEVETSEEANEGTLDKGLIFDYVLSDGATGTHYTVDRDGMVYTYDSTHDSETGKYRYEYDHVLTKTDDPAIIASVSDGAVAFMLGDGTLKLHTLAMPIIEGDASELDFNESYTLTKLNKDEI